MAGIMRDGRRLATRCQDCGDIHRSEVCTRKRNELRAAIALALRKNARVDGAASR